MNRDEWGQWHDDLLKRFPDTAAHISGLDQETRDFWFNELFSRFELRDALEVNRRLFETGEGVSRFERDKLGSLFFRHLQEVSYARRKREDAHRAELLRKRDSGVKQFVTTHAEMGPAYRYTVEKIREWKQSHDGQMPEQYQIHRWVEEIYAQLERAAS